MFAVLLINEESIIFKYELLYLIFIAPPFVLALLAMNEELIIVLFSILMNT